MASLLGFSVLLAERTEEHAKKSSVNYFIISDINTAKMRSQGQEGEDVFNV